MNYDDAINKFDGNISAMARALEVSRQTIYNWAAEGEIPKLRAIQLEYVLKQEDQ
jgi:DNA-binding XRE family transcriptional regulator